MAGKSLLGCGPGVGLTRRIVVERRPKMIIAVACERDLSSGIQDSYPLPVYGIINHRSHGPCYDTLVNLERVEEALQTFLVPGAGAGLPVQDDSPAEPA